MALYGLVGMLTVMCLCAGPPGTNPKLEIRNKSRMSLHHEATKAPSAGEPATEKKEGSHEWARMHTNEDKLFMPIRGSSLRRSYKYSGTLDMILLDIFEKIYSGSALTSQTLPIKSRSLRESMSWELLDFL